MEEKINIAEILKDKKNGLRLYSPIFGECTFCCVREDTNDICVKKHNGVKEFFDSKGLYYNTGEVMLFPSKEMRDWTKFSWKKGDVLQNNDHSTQVIFDSFISDTYKMIRCKYWLKINNGNEKFIIETNVFTKEYFKVNEETRQCYINEIENRLCGKLNLETLEIEKQHEKKEVVDLNPKWTPKPFDRVITRNAYDDIWTANIFSHMNSCGEYVTIGCAGGYHYCLPYNDETAHLLGTTDEWKGGDG